MIAPTLLAELRQRRVELAPEGPNLRYRAPKGVLTPELLAAMREHKAELLAALTKPKQTPVPALRLALRAWYALTAREADGDLPPPAEARVLLSEIRRLWDDTGPAFAEAVHRQEAWIYYQASQRCPTCGERGAFHPGDGGGAG